MSRRRMLGLAGAGAAAAVAAPIAWEQTHRRPAKHAALAAASGTVLFEDTFQGTSLNTRAWNPYITDNPSTGWPWNVQERVANPSSAFDRPNGLNADYDLPSAVSVDYGLTLNAYRGTKAAGFTWTGSAITSYPTQNDFGSGTIDTPGFTFTDARVEVVAKMPDMRSGAWPAIWFLAAPGGNGGEIDLFEGGYTTGAPDPNRVLATAVHAQGNVDQQFLDCSVDLSADYHMYAMEYRQGTSIKIFFDDWNAYTFTENIPTGPYFIILSNTVASAKTVGWHSQVNAFSPRHNTMQISSVRVLSL